MHCISQTTICESRISLTTPAVAVKLIPILSGADAIKPLAPDASGRQNRREPDSSVNGSIESAGWALGLRRAKLHIATNTRHFADEAESRPRLTPSGTFVPEVRHGVKRVLPLRGAAQPPYRVWIDE